MPLTFTIVVCTRNRPQELQRCLAALSRLAYPAFEILVVDNAPVDQQALAIAQRWNARYVVEAHPGLSRARNLGARLSRGEVVAYIDDDAVADPGWLQALAAEFTNSAVGAVTGRILPLKLETEAERIATAVSQQGQVRQRAVFNSTQTGWFEATNFGAAGDGGNMAIRRCCFNDWAGFDERLGRGRALDSLEEHHAFFQLVERGYELVRTPAALVYHPFKSTLLELRECQAQDWAAATAYVLFLFAQYPRYRKRLALFIARALGRSVGQRRPGLTLSWPRMLACWFSGLGVYRKFRTGQ